MVLNKSGRLTARILLAEQVLGVEAQVIFHEGGDGEVAVIVPRLNAQRQRPVALARQLR